MNVPAPHAASPKRALSAARHPALRPLATAVLFLPAAVLIGALVALFEVLSEPLPVGEKILWTLLLGGVALVLFLFGWYLSILGHAVADLGDARAPEESRS